ncbi:adhesive domain-containing protein [Enterococcus sp. 22-H-5-01]|uniref:adhesive domain-containing protein n=1 Tax=Enterococcus sp. 22-H-5-01 TaxID=3418555 RepID=UPI003CFF8022
MIILVAIVLSLATTNSIVSAVSVDLFAKTDVKNNSNTTQTAPYLNVDKQPVTFTIDGSTTGVGLIKTGTKYAYISIPAELSGKVTLPSNPQTTVTAKVTILKADLPIGGLLTSLNSVLGSVTGILLTNLSNAINALQNEDFGTQTMTITTQQPLSTLLVADISQGLLPILTKALITRLENVKNELNKIILLGDTISNLLTSINTLISALNDTTSTTSKNLVAASILGTTNITMPTLVSSPTGLAQDYTANIRGGITQSDAITVDILSSFGNNTAIYFSAGSVVLNGSQLPANLNFGTHTIQTVADENWLAYVNGNSTNGLQTGMIRIDDTRSVAKSWQLNSISSFVSKYCE